MIQTKRIIFSVGLGIVTLLILIQIISPFKFDFKFTGLFIRNDTSNKTEPLLESLAETTTTIVFTTTSTPTTTVLTTTMPVTTTSTTTTTPVTTTLPAADHVVFSEVFYDTPGTESDEEWIELYNPTSNSIDISGLTIENKNDHYLIPNGTIISHYDFLVIARNQTGFQNLYGDLPDLSGLTLSLHNDGDVLRLKNGSEEIDMVAWENYVSGWDLVANEDESIQRDPPEQDSDTSNDWTSHANPDPDTGGLITTSSTTTTVPVSTTTTTSTSTTTTSSTTTISLTPLSLNVTAQVNPIVVGNNQTITTKVTDASNPVENATVNVTVTYASSTPKKFGGLTNSAGIFSFSWQIGYSANPGIFVVNSTASKEGYSLCIGSTTFNVTES